MQIFTKIEAYSGRPLVLAIGSFDGFHLGHQKILKQVVEMAGNLGAVPAVLTFQQHPQSILQPERPSPKALMTSDQKFQILESLGIEVCFFLPFTLAFSKVEAETFVKEILLGRLGMKAMCLGYNAHFGHDRKGNAASIKELASKWKFRFEEIGSVSVDDEPVSSSRLRKLIMNGELEEAERCLGRPWSVTGKVVSGKSRGKKWGFRRPILN